MQEFGRFYAFTDHEVQQLAAVRELIVKYAIQNGSSSSASQRMSGCSMP
jgi:hypothetical protein